MLEGQHRAGGFHDEEKPIASGRRGGGFSRGGEGGRAAEEAKAKKEQNVFHN